MSLITVLIADDFAKSRETVRAILELESDLRIVGEANNGLEALHAVRRLAPDIVLMDHHMPLLDGLETTHLLKTLWPHVAVIFLTGEESSRQEAYRAGAEAFLLKGTPPETLITTIHDVAHRHARRPLTPTADPSLMSSPGVPARPG